MNYSIDLLLRRVEAKLLAHKHGLPTQCVLYRTVYRKMRFIMFFEKSERFDGYKEQALTAHFAIKVDLHQG